MRWALPFMVMLSALPVFSSDHEATEDAVCPSIELALGIMETRFSPYGDPWKAFLLDASVGKPDEQWLFAVSCHSRPEGKATFFFIDKAFSLGGRGSFSLGLGGRQGDDFLPRLRVEGACQIRLGHGFEAALMAAQSRFTEDLKVRTLQLGPSWSQGRWAASARYQRLDYQPDAGHDHGYWLDIDRTFGENGMWHSLRLAYGHGILESRQGSLSTLGPTGSRGGASYGGFESSGGWAHDGGSGSGPGPGGPKGSQGTFSYARYADVSQSPEDIDPSLPPKPLPKERMLTLLSNWPIHKGLSLRTELSWGDREDIERVHSASLQVVVRFR